MLARVKSEHCPVWLMTSGYDRPGDSQETLPAELAASRLGENLQHLEGPEILQEKLLRLGDTSVPADSTEPHMLLLNLEDSASLCELMRSVRKMPALQALPVIVLVGESHSLDLRRVYGSGINSVVSLPRERARRHQVLEVLACYWLDTALLAGGRS